MGEVLGYNNFCATCKGSKQENGKLVCRDRKGKFYGLSVEHVLLTPCFKQKSETQKYITMQRKFFKQTSREAKQNFYAFLDKKVGIRRY